MRRTLLCALIALVIISLAPQAAAQEETFAVRFGIFSINPTSDTVIMGMNNELKTAYGPQGTFEWYFADRFGIEGSGGWGFDADLELDGNVFAGVSILPLTAGINWHPVKTPKVDWGIGALASVVVYSDFTFVNTGMGNVTSVETDSDAGFGVHTFLDIGGGQWGASFGVKWLDSDFDLGGQSLSVDPIIVSAGARLRF